MARNVENKKTGIADDGKRELKGRGKGSFVRPDVSSYLRGIGIPT